MIRGNLDYSFKRSLSLRLLFIATYLHSLLLSSLNQGWYKFIFALGWVSRHLLWSFVHLRYLCSFLIFLEPDCGIIGGLWKDSAISTDDWGIWLNRRPGVNVPQIFITSIFFKVEAFETDSVPTAHRLPNSIHIYEASICLVLALHYLTYWVANKLLCNGRPVHMLTRKLCRAWVVLIHDNVADLSDKVALFRR